MPETRRLRVFLCHASNDKPAVRELYGRLKTEGWIDPWLDEEKLYPGQDWDLEIEKAVEAADAVIVFLSNNSVTKEGYVQRELRFVLRIADFKPEGTVFVIPVRLDDCPFPRRLSMWQYVDYFPENRKDWAYKRLIGSLKVRADKLSISAHPVGEQHPQTLERKTDIDEKEKGNFLKPTIQSQSIQLDFLNIAGIELIRVSKGKFLMGNGAKKHSVIISYDYYLSRFLVTNQSFKKFVDASNFKGTWGAKDRNEILDHPVVNISWHTAREYCQWLNQKYAAELPIGLIFRLPTEAEWEKAARGVDGRIWPWGNEFEENYGNFTENYFVGLVKSFGSHTTPVGKYSPRGDSPYGIADMAGNVFEWTHSLRRSYPYKIDDGREDFFDKGVRVLRGGSFAHGESAARTFDRGWDSAHVSYTNRGFRLALAPPLPK